MLWLLRILRRILLRTKWILSRLLPDRLADRLANLLAESRSRLHARLPHAEVVFRRIPDELKQAIVLGFFVDSNGRLVHLAANTDDVASHDG